VCPQCVASCPRMLLHHNAAIDTLSVSLSGVLFNPGGYSPSPIYSFCFFPQARCADSWDQVPGAPVEMKQGWMLAQASSHSARFEPVLLHNDSESIECESRFDDLDGFRIAVQGGCDLRFCGVAQSADDYFAQSHETRLHIERIKVVVALPLIELQPASPFFFVFPIPIFRPKKLVGGLLRRWQFQCHTFFDVGDLALRPVHLRRIPDRCLDVWRHNGCTTTDSPNPR
jgi:hypothetical protein